MSKRGIIRLMINILTFIEKKPDSSNKNRYVIVCISTGLLIQMVRLLHTDYIAFTR